MKYLVVFCILLSTTAFGQDRTTRAVYDASAIVPTNALGVRTFPEPPAGFDAVRASDARLATYGLPPRPSDPEALARWTSAMESGAKRSHGPIRTLPYRAGPARRRGALYGTNANSDNWSGVVTYVDQATYSPQYSFSHVEGEFTVPVAQQAFAARGGNVCDNIWDMAVSWVGFDGWSTGDVLQGGVSAAAYCDSINGNATVYCAWGEWYPITSLECPFPVNPGDVVYTEVWNTSSTQGYVYLLDKTQNVYATLGFTCTAAPCLTANSAEYVVERPSSGASLLPLMNYVVDFLGSGSAETFDKQRIAANDTKAAFIYYATMYEVDTAGNSDAVSAGAVAGRRGMVFSASGCAVNGGC